MSLSGPCSSVRRVAGTFLATAILLAVPAAADTAYVDGFGLCAGLMPCFITIQDAVDATAAPAEIFVFPGTFTETVDLAQMDGGVKGDISLITVDGLGSPLPGTVAIEPPMLAAILHDQAEATPFTGDIVIDGFIIQSLNDDGIELENVDGDITIRNVVASNNGSDGLDIEIVTPGRLLTIEDTTANLNDLDGFHIEMRSEGGEVRISRVTTETNGSDGVEVNADDPMFFDVLLVIDDLTSLDNFADGLDVDTGGSVEIVNSDLSTNGDDGVDITVTGDVEIADTSTNLNNNAFFDGAGLNLGVGGTIVLRRILSEGNDIDLLLFGFDDLDLPDLFVMTQSTMGDALEGAVLFDLEPGAHVLRCNRFGLFDGEALVLLSDVSVDAELNWWSSSTGPSHPSNPGGTGAAVLDGANGTVGSFDLLPFLTTDPEGDMTECSVAPTLEATKSDAVVIDDGDGVTGPGDVIEYTVTITHASGVLEAEDVVLGDPVPANTTLVAASVTTTQGTVVSGDDPADATVEVGLGTIFPGGMATVTFRVLVDAPLPAGVTEISNQGTVSGTGLADEPTDDPDTPDDDDPTLTPLEAAPAIVVEKSDALLFDADMDGQVNPGDTILYTVVLSNLGNQEAAGVVFTDVPDPNTALVAGSVTTTQGAVTLGNDPADTSVEVALGALAGGGGSATVQLEVMVLDTFAAFPAMVFNQGAVTAAGLAAVPTDDPATPAADDPTATPVAEPLVVRPIPTLAEWGLVLLAALLAGLGLIVLRR